VVLAQAGGIVMKKLQTSLAGVFILEPSVFCDARGFFLESYNERTMAELGIREHFVQDNHSFSSRNVVRGLHYQVQQPQGKLLRVAVGEILDVASDLRQSSPTFGKWEAVRLSGENKRMLWIPVGLAHGFSVMSESAHVLYKTTDFYSAEFERTITWDDPDLKIDWQLQGHPVVSTKDQQGTLLRNAEKFA
jgi:dTDP-4-dehydrorhamnose 3,5-epimerase